MSLNSSADMLMNFSDCRAGVSTEKMSRQPTWAKTSWVPNMQLFTYSWVIFYGNGQATAKLIQTKPTKLEDLCVIQGRKLWNGASIFVLMECTLISCSSHLLYDWLTIKHCCSLGKGYRQSVQFGNDTRLWFHRSLLQWASSTSSTLLSIKSAC